MDENVSTHPEKIEKNIPVDGTLEMSALAQSWTRKFIGLVGYCSKMLLYQKVEILVSASNGTGYRPTQLWSSSSS